MGLVVWLACAAAVAANPGSKSVTSQVEDRARGHLAQLAEHENWLEPRVSVSVVTSGPAQPTCGQPLEIDAIDTRYPTRMRFGASCPGQWRHTFVVRAEVSARVLLVNSNVAAGRPIDAADLLLERRSVSATPDATSDEQAVVGLSSRRALRSGDIVRTQQLVAPLLVRRGDAVRIVAHREQIEVTMVGEALEAGARAALVRVRNTGTGKVIQARVIDSGTVEPAER